MNILILKLDLQEVSECFSEPLSYFPRVSTPLHAVCFHQMFLNVHLLLNKRLKRLMLNQVLIVTQPDYVAFDDLSFINVSPVLQHFLLPLAYFRHVKPWELM